MTNNSLDLLIDERIESKVLELLNKLGLVSQVKQEESDDVIRGIDGLADFLGICYSTAYKLVGQRGFPHRKWKRVYLFRKSEVLDYMEKKTNRS